MSSASLFPSPQRWTVIAGTRPEAIKLAPICLAAQEHPGIALKLLSTGQHRALLDSAFSTFELTPDDDLQVMKEGQSLAELTAALLAGITTILRRDQPQAVLVQGDTTSALCGALAAFYERIPFYHIEAGLRSARLDAPFPEEANRRLIAQLAARHFAPTVAARTHLLREGVAPESIEVTGNTGIDALYWMRARLASLSLKHKEFAPAETSILVTAHRRENRQEVLVQLCRALQKIVADFPSVAIIFPLHPNPEIAAIVQQMLGAEPMIRLCPPLDYAACVALLDQCHFVITDSGGIQEEAAALGKPTLVIREVTERIEALNTHTALLAGTQADSITALAERLLRDGAFYQSMAQPTHVYGDGQAAPRIVETIYQALTPALQQEIPA